MARTSASNVISAAAIPVLNSGINHIELIAAWNALVWFYNCFGDNPLWLEGDSRQVIELLNRSILPEDESILVDCKVFLSKLKDFRVSHIYREGNAGADFMADCTCCVNMPTIWESNFPEELLAFSERYRTTSL